MKTALVITLSEPGAGEAETDGTFHVVGMVNSGLEGGGIHSVQERAVGGIGHLALVVEVRPAFGCAWHWNAHQGTGKLVGLQTCSEGEQPQMMHSINAFTVPYYLGTKDEPNAAMDS